MISGPFMWGRLVLAVFTAQALVACNNAKVEQAKDAASFAVATPGDPLAHGERLTFVLGCQGCHDNGLTGQKWDDDPNGYGIMWSSNLTRSIPLMTDAQLQGVLRRGVHPARDDLWVMPSQMFQHLSAPDMNALIAYLRSLPPTGTPSPPPMQGPKARAEVAQGAIKPAAALVREYRDVLPADAGPQFAQGRYIASQTCAECHGMRLEGVTVGEGTIPNLIIAGAYSPAEFDRFITTGVTPGNRKINSLMVQVARSRFSQLTPGERSALYAYLHARAELPQ